MIGGIDIVIELPINAEDVDFVIRFFAAAWPEAVVSLPEMTKEGPIRGFLGSGAAKASEWLVYRDQAARTRWAELGFTEQAADAAVFITFENDAICFVVDSEASASGKLVDDLRTALEAGRLSSERSAA